MPDTRADLMRMAHEAISRGDHRTAESCFANLLQSEPQNPLLMLELAVQQAIQGKHSPAQKTLSRAAKLAPGDPNIPFNLALLERENGRYSEAERYFRRVLELDPHFPEIGFDLAETLYHTGSYEEALKYLDGECQRYPVAPQFAAIRAACLNRLGRRRDAIAYLHSYLQSHQDAYELHCMIGTYLRLEAQYEQAFLSFEIARKVGKIAEDVSADAADVYVSVGANALAEQFARKVPIDHKDYPRALSVLGQIYAARGDFDAANEALNTSLKLDPNNSMSIMRLSQTGKLTPEMLETANRLFSDEDAAAADRINAGHTLYKRACDVTDAERFHYLKTANDLQGRNRSHDDVAKRNFVRDTLATYTSAQFERAHQKSFPQPTLVFIVGMPRSGTTLVEEILSRCTGVHAGGETQHVPTLTRTLKGYPHCVSDWSATDIETHARALLQSATAKSGSAAFVTDKLPGNYSYVGLIKLLLPDSKIVYCRRHPADNALSLYEQNFGTGRLAYSCDLTAIAKVYRLHIELMNHWRENCGIAVHEVEYEAMVESPEEQARALLEFVGLEWDPACLKTAQKTREINTASVWQARQPIYTGSVGKWRRYEEQMQPFLNALGEI